MRIGKPIKKSRAWKKAGGKGNKQKPKHISTETVVGQVSSDLIGSFFAPKLKALASESLQRYAEEMLHYDDAVKLQHQLQQQTQTSQAEIGVQIDGFVLTGDKQILSPPKQPLFHSQARIDELEILLSETSEHFMAKGWKVHANAAKFERFLDEKYGILRPFITEHPEIEQFIRSLQRKYAMGYFSPLRQGPPPIPRSTAVILLFMLQRGKVQWEIVLLATLFFLVGLQPWALVAIVCILQALLHRRKRKTVGKMPRTIPAVQPYYRKTEDNNTTDACDKQAETKRKQEILLQPVGSPLGKDEHIETAEYDTIMIGYGPGTLYAASLLSRAGRKVLVLSSATDASGCLTFQNNTKFSTNIPFDVDNCNIAKISRQQEILAPALATATDCQGGIRFAKIGSQADGYAFEILSIPGMGTDGRTHQVPFILKASGGVSSLMEDAAMYLGDNWPESDGDAGDSLTGQYVAACENMNASASRFYLSKILPESVNKLRADTRYTDATLRNCTTLLNTCFPLNAHLRSLMAGIGMKGENLTPNVTSMAAHVTNVCNAVNDEGTHYPIGGPRALCHALAHVIEQSGGRVVTNATVAELLFDETIHGSKKVSKNADEPLAPCCVGVKLRTEGQEVRFSADRYQEDPPHCPVVVSMEGFIQTFIRFLPDDIRSTFKVPRGVPALSERRPVVHFLFALKGSASELNITGADYYRLPGAAIARDEVDPTTGEVSFGEIGWSNEHYGQGEETDEVSADIAESTNQEEPSNDDGAKTNDVRRKKKQPVKFEAGLSWIRISFPSAKDPSFEARHGNVTTCVVTIEADDEFVALYDTKPKIFMIKKTTAASGGELQRLCERVRKDLYGIYPQLEGTLNACVACIGKSAVW
jgi:hypothetical protein